MINYANVDRSCSCNQWLTLLECFHPKLVLHPRPARPFYLPQHLQNSPVSIHSWALAQTAPTAQHSHIRFPFYSGLSPRLCRTAPVPAADLCPSLCRVLPQDRPPLPVSLPSPIALAPDPQCQPESPPCARPCTHALFPSGPPQDPSRRAGLAPTSLAITAMHTAILSPPPLRLCHVPGEEIT